jgi:hypothetical protein
MSAGTMEMGGLLTLGVDEAGAQFGNVESQDEKVASFLVRQLAKEDVYQK